jgi:hypothetical protein
MPLTAQAIKPANIVRKSYRQWLQGVVTAYDDGRTPPDGLRNSGNVVLSQDGTIRPRPSLIRLTNQPPSAPLGEIYEFTQNTTSGKITWMIAMCVVGGVARPYIAKDFGTWQVTTGKTYDTTALTHFVEIDDKVVIMNGVDFLSFFDTTTAGTTNSITAFTQLNPASSPVATRAGTLTAGALTYYYRITANSTFGQTAATSAATVTVNIQREGWSSTTGNGVTVTWTASSNATASTTYNVFVGVASGQEFLIASGINGTSFTDYGTMPQDSTQVAPTFDNTLGPKTTRGWVINGQLFMTGDTVHPRYVWYGGTGQAVLDFSPLNGGGNVEIGRGTKEYPVAVRPFRNHSGDPVIAVLCQGTNGGGKRYNMRTTSVTQGNFTLSFFDIEEDNGQAGTDSPDGVILYNDSLWYPSRDGFKTTGTKPQLQNVLSTSTISETIITDIPFLNAAGMSKCVGLAYQQTLYWAVANGSSSNNEIWILDLQRGGAWMKPWNIAADWMMLYNANATTGDGNTHFIILKGGVLYELSYAAATNDDGTAFPTNVTSGVLKFSEDGMDWAHLLDVTFVLQRPQGAINVTVTGRTEDSQIAPLGASNIVPDATVAGWGEAGWGGSPDAALPLIPEIFGWSDFSVIPKVIGTVRYPITIDVDEDVNYFSWELDTNSTGVDYQLSDVVARYVLIGAKDLS